MKQMEPIPDIKGLFYILQYDNMPNISGANIWQTLTAWARAASASCDGLSVWGERGADLWHLMMRNPRQTRGVPRPLIGPHHEKESSYWLHQRSEASRARKCRQTPPMRRTYWCQKSNRRLGKEAQTFLLVIVMRRSTIWLSHPSQDSGNRRQGSSANQHLSSVSQCEMGKYDEWHAARRGERGIEDCESWSDWNDDV